MAASQEEGGLTGKTCEGNLWGESDVLYLDSGVGICQNVWNGALKVCAFPVSKFYLSGGGEEGGQKKKRAVNPVPRFLPHLRRASSTAQSGSLPAPAHTSSRGFQAPQSPGSPAILVLWLILYGL